MQAQDIQDVLTVQRIINEYATGESNEATTIAAVLIWRDGGDAFVAPDEPEPASSPTVEDKPKGKRGKATESSDSDFEPTPDPSDEPDF